MTREETYNACLDALGKSNCLLLEAATGLGKTKMAIDMVNHLSKTVFKGKDMNVLLLVAKRVHKQTWEDEFKKWGGIRATVKAECYESLRKNTDYAFSVIIMDEVHHIGSETRLDLLEKVHSNNKSCYMIGLSATIPRNLKTYFKYRYHSKIVSCDIIEAIEDDVLPEPEIVLMPMYLDNINMTETIEVNPKAKGPVAYGTYNDIWKYKKNKVHAILACTQRQKLIDMNSQILWLKNRAMGSRSQAAKTKWLYECGKRLEYLANLKNPMVQEILKKLKKYRTITFCKTIQQAEKLGKNCIHSKNQKADEVYDKFNSKKLSHITAVNILNENANLVDCKYAIFANLSSSEVVIPQRLGRAMRHRHPVIIMPYYVDTREQEILEKMLEGFNKDYIRVINSIDEI